MNKDFENEIIAIAKKNKDKNTYKPEILQHSLEDKQYKEVIEHLFSITLNAIDIYNSNSESELLSTYRLPREFLEMFLEIPGRREGFCIISPTRIVIFFDEDSQIITVIGKTRNSESNNTNLPTKTHQLFKVSFSKMEKNYEYKDNTGGVLDPYEIVSLLIRWISG